MTMWDVLDSDFSPPAIKKVSKFIGDLIFQLASPRLPVKYHCLPETLNLNWAGLSDPLLTIER